MPAGCLGILAWREKLYAFMTPNAVGASEYFQICRVALSWESRFLTSLWSDPSSRLTSPLALLHFNVTQPRVVNRARVEGTRD